MRTFTADQMSALIAEGPDAFFYVREWGCRPGATTDDVARSLGLHDGRHASLAEGVAMTLQNTTVVFLVPFEGAVFLFSGDIGFSDLQQRLSSSCGSAYTIFLDDKEPNILCSRAVTGKIVREVALNSSDGFSDEGQAGADELALSDGELNEDAVLALAATWGPDPKQLVRAAPAGWVYSSSVLSAPLMRET